MNHFLDEYYDQKQSYDRKARELSKVLTNLSHDIRTPIMILKGNSEILLKPIWIHTDPVICGTQVRNL